MKLISIRNKRESYGLDQSALPFGEFQEKFYAMLKRMGLKKAWGPPRGKDNFFCHPDDLVPKK